MLMINHRIFVLLPTRHIPQIAMDFPNLMFLLRISDLNPDVFLIWSHESKNTPLFKTRTIIYE